jgi:cytochrome c peroxidase
MCHVPDQGFANNELATAVGVEGRTGRRNAPTLYNVAYLERLFHDSRETSLEQQVWSPLLAHNEMANPSVGFVIEKIRSLPDYAGRFEAVFNGRPAGMETIGMALASYERVLTSANSPFDRWYYGNEEDAMPAAAVRGFTLFQGKARCSACHTIGPDYALFTDGKLHDIGVGYARSMGLDGSRRVLVAPGTWIEVDPEVARELGPAGENDLGYYEITGDPADRWKFRTPGLRNVALTAPYMHNGSLATLREVVEFYNVGGVPHDLLDPLIGPLGLSDREIDDLVAFLEALTGDSVDALVSDAFAAPVGNIGNEGRGDRQ